MIVINTKRLKKILGFVVSCAERKSTIPILRNIRIQVVGGRNLRLTATDLALSVIVDLPSDCFEVKGLLPAENDFTVNAQEFERIVKSCSGVTMAIHRIDDKLKIACDGSAYTLDTMDSESYPDIPVPNNPESRQYLAEIGAGELGEVCDKIRIAVSPAQSRFNLNGALFDLSERYAVSTDGHRMLRLRFPSHRTPGSARLLIPTLALHAAAKLGPILGGYNVTIHKFNREESDDKFGVFSYLLDGGYKLTLIFRLLTGNFPDYDRVIPKLDQMECRATFSAQVLQRIQELRRLNNAKRDAGRVLLFEFLTDGVNLCTRMNEDSTGLLEKHAYCTHNIKGKAGYNLHYVSDFTSAHEEVQFMAKDANSAGVFFSGDPSENLYVVMPFREQFPAGEGMVPMSESGHTVTTEEAAPNAPAESVIEENNMPEEIIETTGWEVPEIPTVPAPAATMVQRHKSVTVAYITTRTFEIPWTEDDAEAVGEAIGQMDITDDTEFSHFIVRSVVNGAECGAVTYTEPKHAAFMLTLEGAESLEVDSQ